MKQTIGLSDFRDAFIHAGRKENFSYEALELLFNMCEEIDENMELDVIALCCEYYENDLDTVISEYRIDVSDAVTKQWAAGYNQPGYMPDNEAGILDSFDNAKDSIIETIDGFIEGEENEEKIAQFEEAKDWIDQQTGEFSFTVNNWAFWVSKEADLIDEDAKLDIVREYLNDNTYLVSETSTGFVYQAF